jgi:hypothetical protein
VAHQGEIKAVVEASYDNNKFIHLPRRMLQALSKKNGIHANLTNVAMANALC